MGISASMKQATERPKSPYTIDNNCVIIEENIPEKLHQPISEPSTTNPNNIKPGNPGTWDELHKKVTDLCPVNFDGLQIIKTRKLSKHFNVNHTIVMSGKVPTGYKFGASYEGSKRIGPRERYPTLKGDIRTNGYMNASFVHVLGCRCRFKINAQIDKEEYKVINYALDYRTDDFTVSTKLSDIDPFKFYGKFTLQYLQSLSPRIAIGAEVSCWKDPSYPLDCQTNMSGAFRYSTGRRTISCVLGEDLLRVSYHHVASRELQLGVAVQSDMRSHDSKAEIHYKFDLKQVDAVFHGTINSKTSIGAVIEKKLLPIPGATLLLSAFFNHKNQKLLVGIGLNVSD